MALRSLVSFLLMVVANSTRPLINLMMLPTFYPIEPLPRFLNEPVDRDKCPLVDY